MLVMMDFYININVRMVPIQDIIGDLLIKHRNFVLHEPLTMTMFHGPLMTRIMIFVGDGILHKHESYDGVNSEYR